METIELFLLPNPGKEKKRQQPISVGKLKRGQQVLVHNFRVPETIYETGWNVTGGGLALALCSSQTKLAKGLGQTAFFKSGSSGAASLPSEDYVAEVLEDVRHFWGPKWRQGTQDGTSDFRVCRPSLVTYRRWRLWWGFLWGCSQVVARVGAGYHTRSAARPPGPVPGPRPVDEETRSSAKGTVSVTSPHHLVWGT